jgi:hypothetical protein
LYTLYPSPLTTRREGRDFLKGLSPTKVLYGEQVIPLNALLHMDFLF